MDKYDRRHYRRLHGGSDLRFEQIIIGESDIHVGAMVPCRGAATEALSRARGIIELEIKSRPRFLTELHPMTYRESDAIAPVSWMYEASKLAGVGPMAAVAGAVSQFVGQAVSSISPQVIVENGGDLFIISHRERKVSIYAGDSPLSEKIAILIPQGTWGVCTSSGRVGPSLSMGQCDAAVVLSTNCALADAAATAMGNLIKTPDDLERAVKSTLNVPGIAGALAIMDDKVAATGQIKLAPI